MKQMKRFPITIKSKFGAKGFPYKIKTVNGQRRFSMQFKTEIESEVVFAIFLDAHQRKN